jgi:uncharacterized membrane protein (UPF0136 family)
MQRAGIIAFAYALFLGAGGVIGYLTAGSVASVVSGAALATVALGSAVAMFRGQPAGWYVALTLAAALTIYLTVRAWGSGFMPSGVMALASLVTAVGLLAFAPGRPQAPRRPS